MTETHTLEEFYQSKFNWIPDNLKTDVGHFNVFKIDDFIGDNPKPVPYNRRQYYKISLLKGKRIFHYAHKSVEVQQYCLQFASPQIPYNWEYLSTEQSGCFCVFTSDFFVQFGNLKTYEVFQPNGTHIFELTEEQFIAFKPIFDRMFNEIESDYKYKYDVLRTLILDILHQAMKMQPAMSVRNHDSNASQRIAILFLELLERQFPIEDLQQRFQLRSASDYADQLAIHVNHLNKSLKEITGKSTSDIIAERVIQEAKMLLKNSHWNISEIAYSLGFNEVTHFINFFKKKLSLTPLKFRND